MILISFAVFSAVAQAACSEITQSDIVAVQAPAVIVLGERHGTQPDLGRAARVVRQLSAQSDVTLALEAVHVSKQPALDDFSDGQTAAEDLPAELDWEESWGFSWGPYRPLVTAALWDVDVLAAGPTLEAPDKNTRFPVPPGYASLLVDAMGGHEVEKGMERRFVRSMAWRDNRIAHYAQQNWDQRGYLVIVTGRGHLEGGLGVTWQLQRMLPGVPIQGFTLAYGQKPPCHDGDRVWKQGMLAKIFDGDDE